MQYAHAQWTRTNSFTEGQPGEGMEGEPGGEDLWWSLEESETSSKGGKGRQGKLLSFYMIL